MLTMPKEAPSVVSICGIDPGSNTLGLAILRFSIETLDIVSSEAMTLHGKKTARYSWTTEIHGERHGSIESNREFLLQLFIAERPLQIASESPFFNHLHPSAYGPLVESISAVRQAVMQYDLWKPLYMIDPPTVKNAVGVKGNRGGKEGKELMRQAVLSLASVLKYAGAIPITALDEHSIDALAVAYARYCKLLEELCLGSPKR